jgi:UDP-perosamine 4-acetyltransferase
MGLTERRRLIIAGAGGHARVVLDIFLAASAFEPVGLTDVEPGRHGQAVLGVQVLGADDVWTDLRARGVDAAIAAIGDNRVRSHVAQALRLAGFDLATGIHPRATVSKHAQVGCGVVIMAGAIVNAGAAIGDDAVINTGAIVEHDCQIARDVHIAPGAVLGGGVRVGQGALVGMGATVLPSVSIGEWSVVGAGAVAVHNVPPRTVVTGVPARIATHVLP